MSVFVSPCRSAHNARPASPAPLSVVAFRAMPDRSRLLLRGVLDVTGESARRHVDVVLAALLQRHGAGEVVVLLLGRDRQVVHRVSAAAASPATGGAL